MRSKNFPTGLSLSQCFFEPKRTDILVIFINSRIGTFFLHRWHPLSTLVQLILTYAPFAHKPPAKPENNHSFNIIQIIIEHYTLLGIKTIKYHLYKQSSPCLIFNYICNILKLSL